MEKQIAKIVEEDVQENINDPIADYWDLWDIPEEEWLKATTEEGYCFVKKTQALK